MKKLGIVLSNVAPRQINQEIFNTLDKIYASDKNSSINLFVQNVNWPYRPINYPIFSYLQLQNFVGNVIVTNLSTLNHVLNTPSNNKIIYYTWSDDWKNEQNNGLDTISLLTDKNLNVIINRTERQLHFFKTFNITTQVMTIEEMINKYLE